MREQLEHSLRALQVVYNRLDRKPEERVFPVSLQQELGVLARVPLASGFLSGKYRPGAAFIAPDDVRSSFSPQHIDELLREVEEIERSKAGSIYVPAQQGR